MIRRSFLHRLFASLTPLAICGALAAPIAAAETDLSAWTLSVFAVDPDSDSDSDSDFDADRELENEVGIKFSSSPPRADSFLHLAARARVFNAEYRAAIADYAAAREDVAVARAKFLPQAQVDGSLAAGGGNGAADVYGFSVSQRALDLPRAAIKRAAEFETQAAAADLRALWQALAADVAVARLDAHLALENERLVAARERAVREQWESAKARAAAGGGTRKDELEAFARLQGIRADGFSAASDVAVAMSEISRLSGVSDPALPPLSASFAPLPEATIEEIVFRVDSNSPRVEAARKRQRQTRELREAIKTARFPQIEFSLRGEWRDGRREETARLSATAPLFAGGEFTAEARRLRARFRAAASASAAVRRNARKTAEDLAERAAAAALRQDALRSAVAASREALKSARVGYREGARVLREALDAEEDLYENEIAQKRAQFDYLKIVARLAETAGAIDDDFLARLDSFFVLE